MNKLKKYSKNTNSELAVPIEKIYNDPDNHGWHFFNLVSEVVDWNPNDTPIELQRNGICGDENRTINIGDIIYVPSLTLNGSNFKTKYPLAIVTKIVKNQNNIITYYGYELISDEYEPIKSSNIGNPNNEKFSNNIYIKNFSTIINLDEVVPSYPIYDSYINLDNMVSFSDFDRFSEGFTRGYFWKGNLNSKFREFFYKAIENRKLGKSNKDMSY